MRESMYTRRSNYTLIILAFILVAIMVTVRIAQQRQEIRQRAQVPVSITLTPAKPAIAVGEETTINVQIDTGTTRVANADLQFTFDPSVLSLESLTEGPFFNPSFTLMSGTVTGNTARIVMGNSPTNPNVGPGIAAIIKVKGLANATSTTITLADTSRVSLFDSSIVNLSPTTTTISVGALAPSPSASAAASAQTVNADTVLSVQPGSINVNQGDTVYLPVHIDTGANQVTKVDLAVVYDPAMLDGVGITNAGFLSHNVASGTVDAGVMKIVVDDNGASKNGTGVLVILQFTAKQTGSTTVKVDQSSFITDANTNLNVANHFDASTVYIGAISSVSPTPNVGGACISNRPNPPTGLTAIVQSSNQVLLSWTGSPNTTHYGLVYGVQPNVYIYGAADVGNVTSYTVGNLSSGRNYYFAVFAVNDCAPSEYSNAASATTGIATEVANTGSQTPLATPAVQSDFKPINPNADALSFLEVKVRPSVTPEQGIAASASSSLFFYNLLWIIVAILILLIIIYILYKSRE